MKQQELDKLLIDVTKEIEQLETYMKHQELTDDFYHTNGSFRSDEDRLFELKCRYKQLLSYIDDLAK